MIRIKTTYFVRNKPAGYYIVREGQKASGFLRFQDGQWVAGNMRANASQTTHSLLAAARFAMTGGDLPTWKGW